MRFPFPLSSAASELYNWAIELIPALEAPSIGDTDTLRRQKSKSVSSSTYTVAKTDYVILADTSATSVTITLPVSKNDGWECEIVKPERANRVIILPTGADLLIGETSVEVYDQWTALKFRAVLDGYVIV